LPSPGIASSHERFAQLLMILEAQFGDTMTAIERPRLASKSSDQNGTTNAEDKIAEADEDEQLSEEELASAEADELSRLHALGIPFPGVEIKIDKHVARVWLEDLEVHCAYAVLKDRVRVVLERAVETVASMWTEEMGGGHGKLISNGHRDALDGNNLVEKKLVMIGA
jgi:cleavage and polyadenylation specificity factor subunit 3